MAPTVAPVCKNCILCDAVAMETAQSADMFLSIWQKFCLITHAVGADLNWHCRLQFILCPYVSDRVWEKCRIGSSWDQSLRRLV